MTKLCPRGKAAAKRKFKVYPSAYANAYASKICAGKIKDPSGVKRKDFRGSKAEGGRIGLKNGLLPENKKNKTLKKLDRKREEDSKIFKKDSFNEFRRRPNRNISKGQGFQMGPVPANKRKKFKTIEQINQERTRGPVQVTRENKAGVKMKEPISPTQRRDEGTAMKRESRLSTKIRGYNERVKRAGGGLMEATARLKRQGLKGGGMSSRGLGRAFMKGGRV